MALRAADINVGDEVVLPSHTFVASAAAIKHVGARPILVECGADHIIDVDAIRLAITASTKALMPVQLNGRMANMDAIQQLADENDLLIIEDSCQALGAKFKGKSAGTFGLAGTFSFFPAKTLGCFGDGGALVTNDIDVAEKVFMLRDHGRNAKSGQVEMWGYNSRLDNIQAAILKSKLKTYDKDITRRRMIAAIYDELLKDIPGLTVPPGPGTDNDYFDIFQNYEIESKYRNDLKLHLENDGIGTILQWGGHAIHQFEMLDVCHDLPITEGITNRFLLLPMNTTLTDEDVVYIAESIRQFYTTCTKEL